MTDRRAERRITVVGYRGGRLEPEAEAALAAATLVVGGEQTLAAVPVPDQARRCVIGRLDAALDRIARHSGRTAVLTSGDPGFFGVVRTLAERFGPEQLRVLPTLSSVQAAFARLSLPWDDAVVVSAHGRDVRAAVNACRAHPKVAVITNPGADSGPLELARELTGTGRQLAVLYRLGEPEETFTLLPADPAVLAGLTEAERPWEGTLHITVVLDRNRLVGTRRTLAGPPRSPRRWALHEDAFEHDNTTITTSEVRALALAKLGPGLGDLVWDVGAGSGSVAIECARFGAAAVAIEQDEAACEQVRRNALAHDVYVQVVHGQAPEVFDELPAPDGIFVGGGDLSVIAECARRGAHHVVVAMPALDLVPEVGPLLREAGYSVGGVLLHAERLSPAVDGAHQLFPVRPVFVLWGERR